MENQKIKPGQIIHGWQVLRKNPLKPRPTVFYELKHLATGARYVHLADGEKNNVFCVAFKTISHDNTGIAHILEHTVLTGSGKYPVRDPFFSMLRRSLQTFMNAFTSEDWTAYPFATQNHKDFFNLLKVYLDAAFHPLLKEMNFLQEGHRLELDGDKLVVKGVVYNEMKGSLSSPERLMCEGIKQAIFPSGNYRFNSGGDPEYIPRLTHQDLVRFHERYYHPSNAYFYSSGQLPLKELLRVIEQEVLGVYSAKKIAVQIKNEKRWKRSRRITDYYPVESLSKKTGQHQAAMAWLTAPITDTDAQLALELMEEVLLGNQASPLKKELIGSGLGADMADMSGLTSEYQESIFVCGLKGLKPAAVPAVFRLIDRTLRRIVDEGIEPDLITAALNKQEFGKREISNHPYPYGLKLWFDLIEPWIHGGDPYDELAIEPRLARIRRQAVSGKLVERTIKRYLLDNKHFLEYHFAPNTAIFDRRERAAAAHLDKQYKGLSAADARTIKHRAEALRSWQKKEGDDSCLPNLMRRDIPRRVEHVNSRFVSRKSSLYSYEMPTNGIVYVDIAFSLDKVAGELLPYIPLLCFVLPQNNTRKRPYSSLVREIDAYTGGITFTPVIQNGYGRYKGARSLLLVQGKCLDTKLRRLLSLLKELLAAYDFSDAERLRIYLAEMSAQMENSIMSEGHNYALSLSASGLSPVKAQQEEWYGLRQYEHLRSISTRSSMISVGAGLARLAEQVFTVDNVAAGSIIGERSIAASAASGLDSLIGSLAGKPAAKNKKEFIPKRYFAGRFTATAVSFVAASLPVPAITEKAAPAILAAGKILSRQFLHNLIREQGGAYGAFSRYDAGEGIFQFGSYRDPHIESTLKAFNRAVQMLAGGKFSEEDVTGAILMAVADTEKPNTPAEAAEKDYLRRLYGITDKQRQNFKNHLLKVSKREIADAAKHYLANPLKNGSIVVVSNREKLSRYNAKHPKRPLEIEEI